MSFIEQAKHHQKAILFSVALLIGAGVMFLLSMPIEAVISAVPGTRLVRSITSRGSVEIDVFLDWGSDVVETMQNLQGQIGNIRSTLPTSANISVQQMNVSVYPIEGYSLTSTTTSMVALRDLAQYTIRPVLLQVPGVARVEITGGQQREFWVTVDPRKLVYYHLDIRQV